MKLKSVLRGLLLAAMALVVVGTVIFWRHNSPSNAPFSPPGDTATPPAAETSVRPGTAPDGPPATAPGRTTVDQADARNHFWDAPAATSPDFALFADWARDYAQAQSPAAKAALEDEGIDLAIVRREALAALIQTDPKSALELAVPFALRQSLPPAVAALLEERVSARGDLMVIGVLPLPGHESEVRPITRRADIGDRSFDAYTYDWWLGQGSRLNVPLNGIAVDNVLAVNPSLIRILEPDEAALAKAKSAEAVCSVSGRPSTINHEETVLEVAGEIKFTCSVAHAALLDAQLIAAAGGSGPPVTGGPPLTGVNNPTEGRKRMLLMRPIWSNYAGGMTTNDALNHFNSFSNYMQELSYGKLTLAGLARGSDITPAMLLPGLVAEYDDTGLGKLYNTCKDVARTNYGYDLSQYDFIYVCTAGSPAAGYAGLAFVGGGGNVAVGFHLANGYWDAATAGHEFGHNLGLNHAHFWDTSSRSIIGSGQNVEYGDNNDPMGGGGSPNHYNSRYKNYLSWIPNSDVANLNVTGSGRYRLYCFDLNDSVGLRGLKFTRTASQNYWINFRQRKTSKKALMNGVQLLWTGNNNEGSYLLDVRLKGDADDNAIVIGRTFSDTNLNFHFTPVGLGHTYPESMNVVVNLGSFPGNLPPSVSLAASLANPAPGQTLVLSASATDPNGDTLAYFWEFGDGDYSVDNSATTTHSFGAAGEYTVQCSVSDMKGGLTRRSLVVRVGSPATFRISGRVLDQKSRPLPGMKVFVDDTRYAFSDNDGAYTIAGLATGSYTVDAIEPLLGALSLVHPFFANPVTLGPSAANIDFLVGTSAPPVILVATGAVWKYLDNGSDQGTGWQASDFDDTTWSSGPAQLGYGDNDEATRVEDNPTPGYNAADSNRYITTYFRRAFTVADPSVLTNVMVNLLRDDGGIVYLNGVEVFRSNMPNGPVTYTTGASTTTADDGKTFFSNPVDPALFVSGPNVIAVEIHQVDAASSDVSFDLSLTAQYSTNLVQAALVYLASPGGGAVFTAPTNILLTANALSTFSSIANVEFYDGATHLGDDVTPPYNAVLSNPALGSHILTVIATDNGGIRRTSAPVVISVALPAPPPVSLSLIPAGATWKYFAAATAPPGAWTNLVYNDSAWLGGPAQLGYGEGDEATVISYGGNVNNKWITSYYRHAFTISDPGAVTNLTLQLKRDDGAVVYLNGTEALRDALPAGPLTWGTLATNVADDGQVFITFALDPSLLTPGSNMVAVELHQSAVNTSDSSFDLSLDAFATTNRARGLWLTSPADGATVPLPVNFTAQVVAGGSLGVTKVEFFSDGLKVGETTTSPFTFAWNGATTGGHELTAVATDSTGATIPSTPVTITVTAPPTTTQLVSFGGVWKYLDDGSDQGTNWSRRSFDDGTWLEGNARLGYGGDGEITTVSYGSNPNNRHITTYFRHAFTLPSPAGFTGLHLRLVRDDGAVVYLNGTEIFRSNLEPGVINYNSLAVATINAPDETTPLDVLLSASSLLTGLNVIAVEVHQAAINSSDIGFDLALTGLKNTNLVEGVYLTSPGQGATFGAPATVNLNAFAVAVAGVTRVEFFDGATKLGESLAAPYDYAWNNAPAGGHSLTARATDGGGLLLTSAPVSITVGAAPLPTASLATLLLPGGSVWRYLDNGSNQGVDWTRPAFDDAAWKTGTARFGHGLDGEFTRINTNITTHYFRKWLVVTNPAVFTELLFRLQRDDGAVVHLNGLEIYRSNMPTNAITYATLASATQDSLNENNVFETFIPTTGSGLLVGSNLVAVELHQASAASTDAGFDLELWGLGSTEPRVYLSGPADTAILPYPVDLHLDAHAWAGSGRSIALVEFFDGTNRIGGAASGPFSFVWSNPPLGPHTLTAVATDNGGRVLTSDPATITVSLPTLIARSSVWKYLDNGSNQGTNWFGTNFNDSAWASGQAQLGYGDGDEATRVEDNPTPGYNAADSNRYITTYFRRAFVIPPGLVYTNLTVSVLRDDGAVVYLNGREIFRSNMPLGPILYTTPAASTGADDGSTYFPTNVPVSLLHAGTNIVAVEIHQINSGSSDISFDLDLIGSGFAEPPPPALAIAFVDGNMLVSWPVSATGYDLYFTTDPLPAASWDLVGGASFTTNAMKVMMLSPGADSQFFRLQK